MIGGRVDRGVVERRLTSLLDAVAVLREFQGLSVEELTATPKIYWAVQHGLQLCTQSVLDIAAHLVTALDVTIRDEYRDHVLALGRLGVLSKDFASRIAPMAGFRNILIHEYLDVDLYEVHRVLHQHLDDFTRFVSDIQAYLDEHVNPQDNSPGRGS